MKFGNLVFEDMYFFYFSAINALRMFQDVLFTSDEWATS